MVGGFIDVFEMSVSDDLANSPVGSEKKQEQITNQHLFSDLVVISVPSCHGIETLGAEIAGYSNKKTWHIAGRT
jgi:hypothetical protein